MATAATPATDDFTNGPLYKKLVIVLPIFAQDPFSESPRLNVVKLKEAAKKSHEAVYKWLRSSRLTPENADLLVNLANTLENQSILTKLDRPFPTRKDFETFVYGA